jgi:hypothetical protein
MDPAVLAALQTLLVTSYTLVLSRVRCSSIRSVQIQWTSKSPWRLALRQRRRVSIARNLGLSQQTGIQAKEFVESNIARLLRRRLPSTP